VTTRAAHARTLHQLATLACAALASACITVGPDYVAPSPAELLVPDAWQGPPATAPAGLEISTWWLNLGDPTLARLVAQAMEASPDLGSARARLRETRARRRLAGAELWPTIGATASAQHQELSEQSGFGGAAGFAGSDVDDRDFYAAGFDASWEPDLWGGQRRAREAAGADLDRAVSELRDAQVTLAAEVARNYVEARALQERLAIARANLASQSETLELTRWRVQAGLASSLDAERASTSVEQTRALIPPIETSLAEARHRLAILVGLAPASLRDELASAAPIPQIPDPLTIGIPADVLRQRPDVAAAERALAAETARIGEAVAARYPTPSLSGSIGLEALHFDELTESGALASSVLGSLAQTIFDGGRIGARIEIQNALQEQARFAYQQAVLDALEEVENALVSLANFRSRATALGAAADSARTAALLARHQYGAGIIDFQTVLDTERTVLTVEESLSLAQQNSTTAAIQLYKALGGGWTASAK
jgi:NodT family efflux transporter outer membrane factor (OMF) lipoprotein